MRATTPTADDRRAVRGGCLARRPSVLAAVLLVLCAVPLGVALGGESPASALGNGRFAVTPASAPHHARQDFAPVLSAGGTSTDQVSVANLTTKPITLQLYAADAYNEPTGAFAVEPDFKPKVHMGKWIHLAVPSVTLQPLSGDLVPFTYNVPGNVAPGEYAGGIVAVQTTGTAPTKGKVRVRAEYAIAVPVLGRIAGTLHPQVEVSAVSVTTTRPFASQFGGPVDATVTYSVTNTGNEYLKPTMTVSLSPFIGGGSTYQQAIRGALLPGSTVTFHHTFKGILPFGSLSATVTAKTAAAHASGSSTVVIIPWGIVVIVVLLIVLAVVLVRRRRRRPGPPSELVQPGDAPGSGGTTPPVPPSPVGSGRSPGARGP